MKKVISVLAVLALVVGFAFAADITLKTTVAKIAPAFKIEYTGADGSATAQTGTVVITDKNIADDNITAKFLVSQFGSKLESTTYEYSRYGAKEGTAVEVKVICGKFIHSTDSSFKSGVPSVSGVYASVVSTNSNKLALTGTPATSTTEAGDPCVTLSPTYYGKKVVDQAIGTVTASWTAVPDLPFGTYTASITLEYTAN